MTCQTDKFDALPKEDGKIIDVTPQDEEAPKQIEGEAEKSEREMLSDWVTDFSKG